MKVTDILLQAGYESNKGMPLEDHYALETVKAYIEKGYPVPKKFLPYLVQAQRALNKANQVGSLANERHRAGIAWDVKMLMNSGMDRRDAIQLVANRNGLAFTTVEGWYKGTKHKEAKDDADLMWKGQTTF